MAPVLSVEVGKPALIAEKMPELASVSSLSAATNNHSASNATTTPIQCNEAWKRMNLDVIAENKDVQKKIATYVNDYLFKRLKFFNLEVMLYDIRKHSICQKVCAYMNMAESAKMTFWSTYSPAVEQAVRYARNDAVQAMKNLFLKGKSLSLTSHRVKCLTNIDCCNRFSKGLWWGCKCAGKNEFGTSNANAFTKQLLLF